MQFATPGSESRKGFTLLELMAILAMVGVLVLLAGAGLAHSQMSSDRSVCAHNLRDLTKGWQMYADDFSGALMGNQGNQTRPPPYLSWVAGFLDFSPANSDNVNTAYLTNSAYAAMGLYVKTAASFRCPADHSTVIRPTGPNLRVRSYSMNGYLGQGALAWSIGFQVMTNMTQVPQPAGTLVVLEEHPISINDGIFIVDVADVGPAARLIDYPAAYHLGGANLSMADGHVEYWRWADPRTIINGSMFPVNTATPNDPDVARLQRVSSYRP